MMLIGRGLDEGYLSRDEIEAVVSNSLDSIPVDGKRVLIIIPDRTRTMPMPLMFSLFEELMGQRARYLDYLVALGTHQPLDDNQLSKLIGRQVAYSRIGRIRLVNHEWEKPETFTHIGTIPAEEIREISGGLLAQSVQVAVNKLIFSYDQIIICGPVFPHEVAGFSGGNKYFIPGIAGPEIINFTHWLGALITNYNVIGKSNTPVRIAIDRAAEFIKVPTVCFGLVVDHNGVAGMYFGDTKQAWTEATKLSEIRHIVYKPKPYKKVLSIMPEMYDDLWTAAKGMYKLEPVVGDGGEVIIYAPHIREVSYTHGKLLNELGYHCRDYYLADWDRFKNYPWGVLAHSTHLKGQGRYDPQTGIETARIKVTLATSIPADHCQRINLGYMAPGDINFGEWEKREDEGILVVPRAGETLYRLKTE